MVKKFVFGKPFDTESVVALPRDSEIFENSDEKFHTGKISLEDGFLFEYKLLDSDRVFGLGETTGGIDKRGKLYESWCSDDPCHTEEKKSLYGAHNFVVVWSPSQKKAFGLYFDYPGKLSFDIGYTKTDTFYVRAEFPHIAVYLIEADSGDKNQILSVISQFRKMIGKSYVPPVWAFGFMQSRWGYGAESDLVTVYDNYKKNGIPLDAIFLDIDYMIGFRDFTINSQNFKDFKKTVNDFKEKNIHIVPIIDAGIKVDENFAVDKEGIERDFFCKKSDGKPFAAGVWPGLSHFTDFLNPKAREWFGSQYKVLLDSGIDGFWNDMNEPALFYSEDGLKAAYEKISSAITNKNPDVYTVWGVKDAVLGLSNSMEDYKSFYHRVPEKIAGAFGENGSDCDGSVLVRHDKVHNLYGYNMTRAAAEYFENNMHHLTGFQQIAELAATAPFCLMIGRAHV